MARVLSIPAVVSTRSTTNVTKSGDLAIVNALDGRVIVDPDARHSIITSAYRVDMQIREGKS